MSDVAVDYKETDFITPGGEPGAGDDQNDAPTDDQDDAPEDDGADDAADDQGDEDDQDADDADADEGDGDGDEDGDDTSEMVKVTYGDEEYEVPAALEKAILQEADYTTKTQALAADRGAFEEQVQATETALKLQQEQFNAASAIRAIDIQLAQYAEVNWHELMASDPATFNALNFEKQQLEGMRHKANQDLAYKAQEASTAATGARRKAGEQTRQALSAKYTDWTPQHEEKLAQFAIGLGVPEAQIRSVTNQATLNILYMAEKYQGILDQQAKAKAAPKKKAKAKVAEPAKRVPGRKSTAPRGLHDKLSPEQWVERREQQIRRKRGAV